MGILPEIFSKPSIGKNFVGDKSLPKKEEATSNFQQTVKKWLKKRPKPIV